jgi:hypothetical protein
MDTRFWGPPAWRFLHTLTFSPGEHTATRRLFTLLPYILPCKFCRHSLTGIYEELPMPRAVNEWPAWFYKVHTQVNKKLHVAAADPSFATVKKLYEAREPAAAATFPAWDFLFAVAYTHPLSTPEAPIPDSPNCTHRCEAEKNRWNALSPQARLKYWRAFWRVLPAALPEPWRKSWEEALEKVAPALRFAHRRSSIAWLWRMRCAFEGHGLVDLSPARRLGARTLSQVQAPGEDPYKEVCNILAYHASDCGGKTRAKTCRRFRATMNKKRAHTHKRKQTNH